MKKLILASFALLLVFAVAPVAMADNSSEPAAFQALSKLTAPGQMTLDTMNDEQLASVEGQGNPTIFVLVGCLDCTEFSGEIEFELEADN